MGGHKIKVTFANYGDVIASSRLRAKIPQQELKKLGYQAGWDVLVYGKHWVTLDELRPFKRVIFDVCDDHFGSPDYGDYYLEHVYNADLVTCNTPVMAKIIKENTGRFATVIPDPYEAPEKHPGMGEGILWFGNRCNLNDLEPWGNLGAKVLTEPVWTLERQREALSECKCVLIPTGKKLGKSANRLIESVRNGRFVVAGEIPSHDEFKPYMWIGQHLDKGLQWMENNRLEAMERVKDCQDYIRARYSPRTIALRWIEAIEGLR